MSSVASGWKVRSIQSTPAAGGFDLIPGKPLYLAIFQFDATSFDIGVTRVVMLDLKTFQKERRQLRTLSGREFCRAFTNSRYRRQDSKMPQVVSFAMAAAALLTLGFVIRLNSEKETAKQAQADAGREAERAVAAECEARTAQAAAEAEKLAARRALAKAQFAVADQAYRQRNWIEAGRRLDEIDPALRDASWRYLKAQADETIEASRAALGDGYRGWAPRRCQA